MGKLAQLVARAPIGKDALEDGDRALGLRALREEPGHVLRLREGGAVVRDGGGFALRVLQFPGAVLEQRESRMNARRDIGRQAGDGRRVQPGEQVRSEDLVVQRLGDPLHARRGLRRIGPRLRVPEGLAVEEERGNRQALLLEIASGRGVVRARRDAEGKERKEGH